MGEEPNRDNSRVKMAITDQFSFLLRASTLAILSFFLSARERKTCRHKKRNHIKRVQGTSQNCTACVLQFRDIAKIKLKNMLYLSNSRVSSMPSYQRRFINYLPCSPLHHSHTCTKHKREGGASEWIGGITTKSVPLD